MIIKKVFQKEDMLIKSGLYEVIINIWQLADLIKSFDAGPIARITMLLSGM